MKLLLDTCAFLWFVSDPASLSKAAAAAIQDPANGVWLSSVSAWEIGRKYARGHLVLPSRPDALIPLIREQSGIQSLPVTELDALTAEKLPLHHRDPFDRLLIGQAITNGMTIVSPDAEFHAYPVTTIW